MVSVGRPRETNRLLLERIRQPHRLLDLAAHKTRRNLDDIVATMLMADVSVPPEKVRVGKWTIVIEHFLALANLTQRRDSQNLVGMIHVCLDDS